MTLNGWIQIAIYCAIVVALVKPLGWYMTRVFNGERTFLSPVLPAGRDGTLSPRRRRRDPRAEIGSTYTVAMLLFHVGGFLILYALMRLQGSLPFNPQGMTAVPEYLSFNTAISFITNTNWQNYGGESTLSYLVQMLGLTHQNFLSAATGIVLAVALIRGFARASAKTVGNFWVDITRCTLYILIPICVPFALFLVWQGMPQTLGAYVDATTLEGAKQTIAVGPVASQIAIKMLGTNGGGFFNANAAHPFENPTALSNLVQMISIFALGAALTNVFGRMVGNQRQGWAILAAMGTLFLAGVVVCYWAEAAGNPNLTALGLDPANMEGKEVRFGVPLSALFAVITTAASCGAVNAMHDSFTALGGMIPLINIQLGEIIVGGVGAGMYGMLLFVIIAVFVAGLMVGRTPEYVGKKIEAKEVKMAMLAILVLPLMYLGWTAVATVLPSAVASIANPGPHGFSEILYLYTSSTGNNGSAFGGITGNTLFYNVDRRRRDVRRPLLHDHPGHGHRRLARRQEDGAAVRRHLPDRWRPVRRPGGRRDPDRRRSHLLPRARARTDRRASRHDSLGSCSNRANPESHPMETSQLRKRMPVTALTDPKIVLPAIGSAFAKLDPRLDDEEPGDVRGRGRRGAHHRHLRPRLDERRRASCLHVPDHRLAVVHRAVCQFRRSRGRRPRQGAGREPAPDPRGDQGQAHRR